MDFGFYIDSKGRTVTECQCGSFVVFVPESEAISRLCFRCGKDVERPILGDKKRMDIDSERDDQPDDLEELNDNEVLDYTDEEVTDEEVEDLDDKIEDEEELDEIEEG